LDTTLAINYAAPQGNLEQYIQSVNLIPSLTAEEEQELAKKFLLQEDLLAARKLVMAHLKSVVHVARGYNGYGLAQGDLIQEGNIGLMKAVKRFDPAQGVRLISFAVHWIRAEMHEFILKNWKIVKVATTKAQRKMFFNLRKSKKHLGWFSNAEVTAVAKDLNVSPEIVRQMEGRMNQQDSSFDPAPDAGEDEFVSPSSYLQDNHADPAEVIEKSDWSTHNLSKLEDAMATLDARSQDILQKRWIAEKKATLQDLANHYNISAERIRQLENNAIKKLKNVMVA